MQSYYWREGFEAAESGKSIDDNPYRLDDNGNMECDWDFGWKEFRSLSECNYD